MSWPKGGSIVPLREAERSSPMAPVETSQAHVPSALDRNENGLPSKSGRSIIFSKSKPSNKLSVFAVCTFDGSR